jgi:hypothetical protein
MSVDWCISSMRDGCRIVAYRKWWSWGKNCEQRYLVSIVGRNANLTPYPSSGPSITRIWCLILGVISPDSIGPRNLIYSEINGFVSMTVNIISPHYYLFFVWLIKCNNINNNWINVRNQGICTSWIAMCPTCGTHSPPHHSSCPGFYCISFLYIIQGYCR